MSGSEEARKGVRQSLYDGADCIKVIVDQDAQTLSLPEMKVIVEEAHPCREEGGGPRYFGLGSEDAAAAGVDSIRHAYSLSEEQAKLMAGNKVFLVPTDWTADVYLMGYEALTPEAKAR